MGRQKPPAPQDALQQAAVTAGVKANTKQAADHWRAKVREKSGFCMPADINRAILLLVLDNVAHVSENVITQFKALSELVVQDFFPPVPAGETPLAMPADVHFATFVPAFMETLEYGTEGARGVWKGRVSHLRGELEAVQKSVEVNLLRHFSNLSP